MALPSDLYFVAFPPQILFRDKDTALPLIAGSVYFYSEDDRTQLKPIYKQVKLPDNTYQFVEINNPVTLSAVGSFADDDGNDILIYLFPYTGTPENPGEPELYYLQVYNVDSIYQFDREAYPPNFSPITGNEAFLPTDNQITNPQFVDVLFDVDPTTNTYSYNATGSNFEVEIAPGWSIVTTGAGAVTLQQVAISDTNVVSNPPYALQIQTGGSISAVTLRQRILASPTLFYGGYINGQFSAKGISPNTIICSMNFNPSSGTQYTVIESETTDSNGEFTRLSDTKAIDGAIENPDLAPDGYVDVDITWTPITTIQITSVQIAGVNDLGDSIQFVEQSTPMQENGLFYYFNPLLQYKPIPSLLVGWDFPLNPSQFNPDGAYTLDTTLAYGWDQTLTQSVVGNIAVVRNAVTNGFQATTANDDEAFYMMQYLTGAQAKKILGTKLSVNVNAFRTQAGGDVNVRVYLYRAAAASSFPVVPTVLGTLTAAGAFSLTAGVISDGWTEIPRSGLGLAVGTLTAITTADYDSLNDTIDLRFSGWEMTTSADIADTDKFAIVATFECPTTGTVITVNSISLVEGEIATRPASQTADQVLTECQAYYETSFENGTTTAAITAAGTTGIYSFNLNVFDNGTLYVSTTYPFLIEWQSYKVLDPTVTLYSGTTTTAGRVQSFLKRLTTNVSVEQTVTTIWGAALINRKRVYYPAPATIALLQSGAISTSPPAAWFEYHYIADARLGAF